MYNTESIFTVFGNYERAKVKFEKVVHQWPESELADEAFRNSHM